jgi:hypothetical protein
VSVIDLLRPSTKRKLIISLILAYSLGWLGGPLIEWANSCWGPSTQCEAYSPRALAFAQVLSWPVLTTRSMLEGISPIFRVDILVPLSPAFLLLWLYYYVLYSGVDYLLVLFWTGEAP